MPLTDREVIDWMKGQTWTCHVCQEERPDDKISVAKHVHVFPSGVEMTHNVRYCNDKELCRITASHNDFSQLKLQVVTDSLREAWDENRRVEKMFWHGLGFGLAIGFLIPLAYGISL